MNNTKDIILYKDELGDHITIGMTEYKCKEVFNTYVDENEVFNTYDEYDMRESIVEDLVTNSTNFSGTSSDDSLDELREYVGEFLNDLVGGTVFRLPI